MSGIFFFTEPHKIQQDALGAFGPVDKENYQTTSYFTLKQEFSSAKIYAAFKGYVFLTDYVDPLTDAINPLYVNMVLMPIVKSAADITPGCRCIVYRGLKRSDFMARSSASDPWQILSSSAVAASGTDLMKKLYERSAAPTLETLIYTPFTSTSAVTPLFNIFKASLGRAIVEKGMWIGNIDNTAGLGIDVVLSEYTKFVPIVRFAAYSKNRLLVNADSASLPGEEVAQILLFREQIHSFIDPAVYYNLFRKLGVEYVASTGNKDEASAAQDKLHTEIISKFITASRLYVDIRNNVDFSLNFYQDNKNSNKDSATYTDNLKMGKNGQAVSGVSYYTLNWPILIIEDAVPVSGKNFNAFKLSFYTHYNPQPLLYLDLAIIDNEDIKKSNVNTIADFKFARGSRKFIDLTINATTQLTEVVKDILTPATSSGVTTAWIIKLYYLKQISPNPLALPSGVAPIPSRYVPFKSPFDNVFGPFDKISVGGNLEYNKDISISGSFWRNGLSKRFIPAGSGNAEPMMAQTAVGLSEKDFTFLIIPIQGKDAANDVGFRADTPAKLYRFTGGESDQVEFKDAWQKAYKTNLIKTPTQDGVTLLNINQGYNPNKSEPSSQPFLFSMNLTRLEFLYFQYIIDAQQNLDTQAHPIHLGIDLNSKQKDSKGHYYNKGRLVMLGQNSSGESASISALGYTTTVEPPITSPSQFTSATENLFCYTRDNKTFCTDRAAKASDAKADIKERDPLRGVYTIQEYIDFVKEVERVFDEPADVILSRIRRHYYGSYDKNTSSENLYNDIAGSVKQYLFEKAVPNAPINPGLVYSVYNGFGFLNIPKIDAEVFKKMTSSADENGIEDNPSPYVIDPRGNIIDVGHLLYGLDGLIHDYENTGGFYQRFGCKLSNDLTGYIADISTPAAEDRMYQNNYREKFEEIFYPELEDINRLYNISAPSPDLISDVDPFGLFAAYKYFKFDQASSDNLPSGGERKLSWLLKYYYDNSYEPNNINYPVNANFKKRWFHFCKGHYSNVLGQLLYQGFIEQQGTSWLWKADDVNHVSRIKLRQRAETFAHFWYQLKFNQIYITIYGQAGLIPSYLLQDGNNNLKHPNGVRFEKDSELNPDLNNLTPFIGSTTSSLELDYVLNRFIVFIKQNYENE